MSIQAYDADMVEAPGAETLAAGAVANLWAAFGSVWPLWSALTIVFAIGAATSDIEAAHGDPLQAGLLGLPALVASGTSAAVGTGIAIRLLLGRGLAAWKPDRGLLTYITLVSLLSAGPGFLVTMLQPPEHGAPQEVMSNFTTTAGMAVVLSLVILWATMRLTLWPIGRLLGNQEMTPGRSWRLMRGVVLRYAMAVILLTAPLFLLVVMVTMLTKSEGPLISQIAVTPLTSLMTLLAAAVAVEVFRSRIAVAAEPE